MSYRYDRKAAMSDLDLAVGGSLREASRAEDLVDEATRKVRVSLENNRKEALKYLDSADKLLGGSL